jgi:hypothetical protein
MMDKNLIDDRLVHDTIDLTHGNGFAVFVQNLDLASFKQGRLGLFC